MINDITYRNLSSSTQSWTREVVDQGNGLLISGGDVAQNADAPTYSSGAFVTDYSFHYLLAVHPPAGSPGTAVTYDVTGMVLRTAPLLCHRRRGGYHSLGGAGRKASRHGALGFVHWGAGG